MIPRRISRQAGRHALVDTIPFTLPVASHKTPALIAGFSIDADAAAKLLPGNELYPLVVWGRRGVLLITVVDYRFTNIGRYIEFSVAIACTHGPRPAPPIVPAIPLVDRLFGTGQYVLDLPVSTEVSVKGGKGIWGMPKHQANLDFAIAPRTVWSQYDLDGQRCMRIEVNRPRLDRLPLAMDASVYGAFRGMLMKSRIYFRGYGRFNLPFTDSARLELGPHPRVQRLRALDISPRPLFSAFLPQTSGILDDHAESWFLSYEHPPDVAPEGMESIVNLGQSQEWLRPPSDPAADQPDVELAEP